MACRIPKHEQVTIDAFSTTKNNPTTPKYLHNVFAFLDFFSIAGGLIQSDVAFHMRNMPERKEDVSVFAGRQCDEWKAVFRTIMHKRARSGHSTGGLGRVI